ncbi:MAG: tail protein [Thermodesulfobacteriota bacterium]|nr:MAG: tail protein [Thermodesulfobacteriota bacterium]
MPIDVTYPGVYVEEIPSGVNTIIGASTSLTAFIGRAKWGPVNEPTIINNFGDFQSLFGGLCKESNLGYSVSNFFQNGGSQAVIVRLFKESTAEDSPSSKAQLAIGDFKFEAANPGLWGEDLLIEIDFNVSPQMADKYELDKDKMFNLTILKYDEKGRGERSERYQDLTIEDKDTGKYRNLHRFDLVLKNQSMLLRHKEGVALPKDLNSIKFLANDGVVQYSVKESIAELKEEIDKLTKDKKEEKEKLEKQLNTLKFSDGESLDAGCFIGPEKEDSDEGIYALEDIEPQVFNLMCIPPYNSDDNVDTEVITKAAEYCEKKRAFLIVDPPSSWENKDDAINGLSKIATDSANAALYFPRVTGPDPLDNYQPKEFAPSGVIAGVIARTDETKGIWKAPAGVEAVLQGVEPTIRLTDDDNGELNPIGINCLRSFPVYGNIVWGARTLQGADILQSEWKYVNVRRLALYIQQSLEMSTKWTVFELNDEPLWNKLRSSISNFLNGLYADGAFAGSSAQDAFFVKVDSTTTTQSDIDRDIVNIEVGFAPVKPAEFIILHIQQIAGQTS